MKHVFTLLLSLTCLTSYGQITKDSEPVAPLIAHTAAADPKPQKEAEVYICNSKTTKIYHRTDKCRGLNHCTHVVTAVTKKEAENTHDRSACQICY